jgi:hypothetical protein
LRNQPGLFGTPWDRPLAHIERGDCLLLPHCVLQPLASKFFIFTSFMILCQLAATSLALAVSAVCREVDLSGGCFCHALLPLCMGLHPPSAQ